MFMFHYCMSLYAHVSQLDFLVCPCLTTVFPYTSMSHYFISLYVHVSLLYFTTYLISMCNSFLLVDTYMYECFPFIL
jgi:hypothetical protein